MKKYSVQSNVAKRLYRHHKSILAYTLPTLHNAPSHVPHKSVYSAGNLEFGPLI